jgi:hypothetical protein
VRRTLALALLLGATAHADTDPSKVGKSVFILFAQNDTGGMAMRCTATAFESAGATTRFLTAAHCVTREAQGALGKLAVSKDPLFLSDDSTTGEKVFIRATVETAGREDEGYDFAILSASTGGGVHLTALGDEKLEKNGTRILNIAAPGGLGKVYFSGHVALLRIDRPLMDEGSHIDWAGFMLVQLPAAGGSSGSAVVSEDTGKIIGLVIGSAKGLTTVLPISRVQTQEKKFLLRLNGKDVWPATAAGAESKETKP